MVNLPEFNLPADEHRKRQAYHDDAAKSLKESFVDFNFSKLDSFDFIVEFPEDIPLASNPKWANRNFGAVNTVEKSGSVALIAKMLLNHYGMVVPMEELLTEIEKKGYRMWRLSNSKKTLNMPYPSAEKIKKQYLADAPIQNCITLEEIYQLYGEPLGIGGSMFLIDNIISIICKKPIRVYKDTRIHSIDQLIWNLRNDIMVPMRVQNSVYHDDPDSKDGHYVILTGFSKGNAIVIDSSMSDTNGINVIPANRLLKAMLANEKLICAWNLYPCELFSKKRNS